MAVGFGTNVAPGTLNVALGNAAVGIRDWAESVVALWSYIESLGANEAAQVAALAALSGWSDSETDPQTFWTDANYLYTIAQVYYGNIDQPSVFDFDSAVAGARGGS
jgi:hypothetical protein